MKILNYYDVVISGGGMIGSSLAISLAKSGLQVLVVESIIHHMNMKSNSKIPDLRVSAINYTSVKFLKSINVWSSIDTRFCVPYRQLETWELEYSSSTVVFKSSMLDLPELGFMIENWRLQKALLESFSNYENLELCAPAIIKNFFYDQNLWNIILDDGRLIISRLLVGADGANSKIRQYSGIVVSGWQYRQSCMLLTVETEENKKDITWQVFTPSGPRAFLPLYDNWASLVWYDNKLRICQLQNLTHVELERELKSSFPKRLGNIKIVRSSSMSLIRRYVHNYIKPGLALVGDAAHTINPLAGQGANLGFRDAKELSELLISYYIKGEQWYTIDILNKYQNLRMFDNMLMQIGIDLLYYIFSNNFIPLKILRNLGFISVQNIDFLKKKILKYALGL